MFGSLACLPFPSALLSMLIPVKPTAELPITTCHWAFKVVHNDTPNIMALKLQLVTIPQPFHLTLETGCQLTALEPRIPNIYL